MLYDAAEIDAVVDAEAALELMKEATKLATATELEDIGARLEAKRERFQALLAPDRIDALDAAGVGELTSRMFSLRRKGGRLLGANGLESLRGELKLLLHGDDAVGARLERFTARVVGLERAMIVSLATEALHFVDPERHWLWTYWIWNPEAKNGALALVTHDVEGLRAAASDGEIYERVGRATVLLDRRGHAAGWSRSGRGLFGTDVFLACAYAVYMYTVFRLKLSQEFNRILPGLPELVERVLGVKRSGEIDGR
jgi:hypothetical protein